MNNSASPGLQARPLVPNLTEGDGKGPDRSPGPRAGSRRSVGPGMRHCRRRGLGLRLLAGPPAPRRALSLPPTTFSTPCPLLGFKVTPSGRLGLDKSPAESAKEREQRRPGREAGGLGEEGERTRFHSLGKGDRISGLAGGDQRRPEAPDSDYLYLEIILKNIFYPRSIFF